MYFKSIDDLNRDIVNNLHKLDRDIDLIVGIPRSGLMVASILALYLNLPLTDLQGFIEGRVFESGKTRRLKANKVEQKAIKKVLIVEDSVYTGRAILQAKAEIEKADIAADVKIIYFAAYVTENNKAYVDIFLDVCDLPRIFEWNLMHHPVTENSFFDLDGVLCQNPIGQDDDGENYIEFIENAKPLFVPTYKINTIVTCRLEKYRSQTERWLEKNNIKYGSLIMMEYPSKADRQRGGKHAVFKAYHYQKSAAVLFIESESSQAMEITRLSGKPVYCTQVRKMLYPNADLHLNFAGTPSITLRMRNKINKSPLYKAIKRFFRKLKKFS